MGCVRDGVDSHDKLEFCVGITGPLVENIVYLEKFRTRNMSMDANSKFHIRKRLQGYVVSRNEYSLSQCECEAEKSKMARRGVFIK